MKHLNPSGFFRSGNQRFYYRPKGQKGFAMPDLPPNHPEFLRAYISAAGTEPVERPVTGTIGAGIVAYLASDEYLGLARATRENRRRIADKLRREYGSLPIAGLRSRHIRQDLAKLPPNPANNRLKVWRAACRFWVAKGLIDADPARDVASVRAPRTGGHTPWTRDDLAAFRAHWPVETPQRMAMELIYRTCAAIGDACALGPGNVSRDGWLTYRRAKSQTFATCPFLVPGPDWYEGDAWLAECMKHAPNALTYLATKGGRPRSPKAATQWFARACRAAGLDDGKTAHGLRKLRAAMFRENGASKDQRMAILGHETEAEADHYSKSADHRKIIAGTESSNPVPTSPKDRRKSVT
ncbi:tyrosine-type recombinase/integrase [Vannielia litorea]|uniref:tyrosine-type recombinase/integrase n=1 Tax=Vannielia litorea TaxID=1217970 RepID=UPI001BD1B8C3|nr:tyrosine-type recombinase/integrase [Vannielia litorea]